MLGVIVILTAAVKMTAAISGNKKASRLGGCVKAQNLAWFQPALTLNQRPGRASKAIAGENQFCIHQKDAPGQYHNDNSLSCSPVSVK